MAHYWLDRIQERRAGGKAAARAYERFIEAWRAGDNGLVLASDARARLTRLRVERAR